MVPNIFRRIALAQGLLREAPPAPEPEAAPRPVRPDEPPCDAGAGRPAQR